MNTATSCNATQARHAGKHNLSHQVQAGGCRKGEDRDAAPASAFWGFTGPSSKICGDAVPDGGSEQTTGIQGSRGDIETMACSLQALQVLRNPLEEINESSLQAFEALDSL